VLSNRFRATRQNARLISGDRSGNAMESRMTVLWKSFRDENDKATEGVFSKTVVRYTHPFDLRFSAYLVTEIRRLPANDRLLGWAYGLVLGGALWTSTKAGRKNDYFVGSHNIRTPEQ
jgi:hypothetical protein